MVDLILQRLINNICNEELHGNNKYEELILVDYDFILDILSSNHDSYVKYISNFLSCLERYNQTSQKYSLAIFFNLYEEVLNKSKNTLKAFDTSIFDLHFTDEGVANYKEILENYFRKNNKIRISDNHLDLKKYSKAEIQEVLSLILNKLQNDAHNLIWSNELIELTTINLAIARELSLQLGQVELFYYSVNILIDRLTTSELNQPARDFCEEVLLASFKDDRIENGFFTSYSAYSNQSNFHPAIVYANLCLSVVLKKADFSSERLLYEIIWQSMKFFRNLRFYNWGAKMYSTIPKHLNFSDYHTHALDFTYISTLLLMRKKEFPQILLDYLNQNREYILAGGEAECMPWLSLLYNMNSLYPNADFSAFGLGFYLTTFELVVPKERLTKHKAIAFSQGDELKKYLIESLVKLAQTRNKSDFVYDNEKAIIIASKLIEFSMKTEDADAILLAMMIKSDYTLVFRNIQNPGLTELKIPEGNEEELRDLYNIPIDALKSLPIKLNDEVVWLAVTNEKVFQLIYFNKEFQYHYLEEWYWNEFLKWRESEDVYLEFDITKKDSGGVVTVSPEEFRDTEKKISKKISFAKICTNKTSKGILLVKDMEISLFPHNLLLDYNGEFLAKKHPITNVLSTEWLYINDLSKLLPINYTKSIWIPLNAGDMTLALLFSKIESTLDKYYIEKNLDANFAGAISSDINIIVSHGDKSIATDHKLHINQSQFITNSGQIIGTGKILILFVCHSGSMKNEILKNEVSSLIKQFLMNGYAAVIAPFWSLHIYVPPIWLPAFLESIDAGRTVSEAVFDANSTVFNYFPTPAAWACMHNYGNPYFKRKKSS
ncbi:MAG: hypothetical protein MH472_02935 [Bacteroidia bacterium]|nr:hypothetical protein [Bacteroidia bacterium]